MKPLGRKAYGSIPHLPGSRLGPGDYHCSEGQAAIACEKVRDLHDMVIVQEKLDGANVAVAKVSGKIFSLSRAGYLCETSKFSVHHSFKKFVDANEKRFSELLNEGERICGEWLAQAVGTRYNLPHEPFVAFDLMVDADRKPYSEFIVRTRKMDFITPQYLSVGPPVSVIKALQLIDVSGHGAIDPVEGIIWRVERKSKVDFLVKYVRHDKEDGKYFPERNGGMITWNSDEWRVELPNVQECDATDV